MKTLYICHDEFTAELIRGLLVSSDIPARIHNQNSRYVPPYDPGRLGVQVVVADENYEEAARLLLAHGYRPDGIEQVHACPVCGSWNTKLGLKGGKGVMKKLLVGLGVLMALLSIPGAPGGVQAHYRCRDCGEDF